MAKELIILTAVAALWIVLGIILERRLGLHPGRGMLNLSCDLDSPDKKVVDENASSNGQENV